ncbi:hypothetical protein [Levilactobacillus enshiensis]|uniref:hypothetical protein n=1 Tax=Levilactobacillus enshiensis TaxID=2590213 RepID=UPI001179F3DA|nr:hypothetical protein [Levilactobacillus enshiensis]
MLDNSREPMWLRVKDNSGDRVWINMRRVDYASENNAGWTMVVTGGVKFLVKIDFDEFGEILEGGD